MPMIATTVRISIRVKPFGDLRFMGYSNPVITGLKVSSRRYPA